METTHHLSEAEMFDINFGHILEDTGDNSEEIHREAMELIRDAAVKKNIEFDGYYKQRWIDSADTIVSFDEEYFEDPDKRDLYVYLSALVDEEILSFLNHYYFFLNQKDITRDYVQEQVDHLIKVKGVRF